MANSRESTDEDKRLPKISELRDEAYDYTLSHESRAGASNNWKKYMFSFLNVLVLLLLIIFVDYSFKQIRKELNQIRDEIRASLDMQKSSTEIAKIKVTKEGHIYLNKQRLTWEELSKELRRLQQAKGVIWYFTESSQDSPTSEEKAVFKKIIAYKLPVRKLEKDFE